MRLAPRCIIAGSAHGADKFFRMVPTGGRQSHAGAARPLARGLVDPTLQAGIRAVKPACFPQPDRLRKFCLTSADTPLHSRPGHMKWSKRYKPQYLAIARRWTCLPPVAFFWGSQPGEGFIPATRIRRYGLLRRYTQVYFVRPVCGHEPRSAVHDPV